MSEERELPNDIAELIRSSTQDAESLAVVEEVTAESPTKLFLFAIGLISSDFSNDNLVSAALSYISNILMPSVRNPIRKIQNVVNNFGDNKPAIYNCLINLIQSTSEVIRNLSSRILAFYFKIEFNNLDIFNDLSEIFTAGGATVVSQFGILLTMCEIVLNNILNNSYRRIKAAICIMHDCFVFAFQNNIVDIQPAAIKLMSLIFEKSTLQIGINKDIFDSTQEIIVEFMPKCQYSKTYRLWCDLIKNLICFKKTVSFLNADIDGLYEASLSELDVYAFLGLWNTAAIEHYKNSNVKSIAESICRNICESFIPLLASITFSKEELIDGAYVGKDFVLYQILATFIDQVPEDTIQYIHEYISEVTSGEPTADNLISVVLMSTPLSEVAEDNEDGVALFRDMIRLFIENRADTLYQSSELICYFLMAFSQSISESNILFEVDYLNAILEMVKDELLQQSAILDDTVIEMALILVYSIAKRFSNDQIESYLGDSINGFVELFNNYSAYLLGTNNQRLFELLCTSMHWIVKNIPFDSETGPIIDMFFRLSQEATDPKIAHTYALILYGLIENTSQDIGEFLVSTLGPIWVEKINEVDEESTDYINYIWGMFHIVDKLREDAICFFEPVSEKLHFIIGLPQPDVVRAASQLMGHFLQFGGDAVVGIAPGVLNTAIEILGSPSTLTRSAQGVLTLACSAIVAHGEAMLEESAFHILDFIFDYADSLQSLYNEDHEDMIKLMTVSINVVNKILEKCVDCAETIPWAALYNGKEITIFDLIPVIIIETVKYSANGDPIPPRFMIAALSALLPLITTFPNKVMKIVHRREITNLLKDAKGHKNYHIVQLANQVFEKRERL